MSNIVHNYLENKSIQLDKVIGEKKTMEFTPKDAIGQASILKADEDRLKEIAKAFAKNEQRIVVKEIDTDILMEEVKRRFDALQIKINSIKNAMGEE